MNNAIHKLTDIMTIIQADGTALRSQKPTEILRARISSDDEAFTAHRRIPTISNPSNTSENDLIEKDFMDDGGALLVNIPEELRITRIKRYTEAVKAAKLKCGFKCQICGKTFKKDNGEYYCEAHHIIPLSQDGSQDPLNVIILCATHHRMFHYASKQIIIEPIVNGKRKIVVKGKLIIIDYD